MLENYKMDRIDLETVEDQTAYFRAIFEQVFEHFYLDEDFFDHKSTTRYF